MSKLSCRFMSVSSVVGGLALPAYTGGRRLELKQHGGHAPCSVASAPVPDYRGTQTLHGRRVSRKARQHYVRGRAA